VPVAWMRGSVDYERGGMKLCWCCDDGGGFVGRKADGFGCDSREANFERAILPRAC
jgi:hypothetical protein